MNRLNLLGVPTRSVQSRENVLRARTCQSCHFSNARTLSMPRIRSFYLPPIWSCCLILVFSYVLFDLLDIDGSDLRSFTGGSAVAEEVLVSEGKNPAMGCPSAPPAGHPSHSLAKDPVPIPTTLTSASNLHGLLVARPRSTTQERMVSSSRPESDPSRRSA